MESAPGHGSTFSFAITLPLADLRSGARAPAPVAGLQETVSLSTPPTPARILLAEDTPVNQMVLRTHLEDQGFDVAVANNGKEAVEACRRRNFDLVLMDFQMPEMDGIEATGRILAQYPPHERMPIVALTADADVQTRAACKAAGMAAVLIKPIRRAGLIEEVQGILKRHRRDSHDSIAVRQQLPAAPNPEEQENPSFPPLDLETAVYEFGGRQLVRQVVEQLIENGAEQMEEIQRAMKNKEVDIIRQRAHAIKGGAATAEAGPLSAVAAELERQCRTGALDRIPRTVERLASAWDALRNLIRTIDWQQEEP